MDSKQHKYENYCRLLEEMYRELLSDDQITGLIEERTRVSIAYAISGFQLLMNNTKEVDNHSSPG